MDEWIRDPIAKCVLRGGGGRKGLLCQKLKCKQLREQRGITYARQWLCRNGLKEHPSYVTYLYMYS